MMSKINVTYVEENNYPESVPIYFANDTASTDLYMLLKDADDYDKPYKVVSLSNGYLQAGDLYRSIQEFFLANPNVVVLDLDIAAKVSR